MKEILKFLFILLGFFLAFGACVLIALIVLWALPQVVVGALAFGIFYAALAILTKTNEELF